MCNTTDPRHIFILENISTFSLNDLTSFIRNQGLELSCLLKFEIPAELLNNLPLELLISQINKEDISKDRLSAAGMNQTLLKAIFDEKEDSDGDDVDGDDVDGDDGGDDGVLNTEIISRINKRQITVIDIQRALINNDITGSDLITFCGLDAKMIKRIEEFSAPEVMPPVSISELPALNANCTDFYFLGLPAAGKSCLIASLLTHWMRTGICNPEVSNPRGVKYFKTLAGGFSKGILPRSNPNTFIDYIAITLNIEESPSGLAGFFSSRKRKYKIPINLLDMAGEKFEKVADDGSESFRDHKEYLNNDNNKALFFILDYTLDNDGEDAFTQALSLSIVLNNLKDMGILAKTDSIFLILTKADMFPVPKEKYQEYANNYIREYYDSFRKSLDGIKDDFGVEYEIIPYSIGAPIFGELLEDYNPNTNDNLKMYPSILGYKIQALTARYRRGWITL